MKLTAAKPEKPVCNDRDLETSSGSHNNFASVAGNNNYYHWGLIFCQIFAKEEARNFQTDFNIKNRDDKSWYETS